MNRENRGRKRKMKGETKKKEKEKGCKNRRENMKRTLESRKPPHAYEKRKPPHTYESRKPPHAYETLMIGDIVHNSILLDTVYVLVTVYFCFTTARIFWIKLRSPTYSVSSQDDTSLSHIIITRNDQLSIIKE